MTDKNGSNAGELIALLQVLRRRFSVIVLCVLVGGAGTLAFSLSQRKQYSASASLLFRNAALDQELFGSTFVNPVTDPQREAATNEALVGLPTVAQRTTDVLDHGVASGRVSGDISVSANGQSNVVSVTATDPDPSFAARLANTYADQFIAFRRNSDRAKVAQASRLVQQQIAALTQKQRRSPNGQSLRNRSEQLAILAALQTGNAELVQPASVPTSASSPKTRRNVILGALVGLLLGVGLAFLLDRLDRRLKSPDELSEAYGLPLLGAVPQLRALAESNGLGPLPAPASEAFRMLRARMRYFNVDRDIRSILITSPAPKDGKSTVAWHLARTAAMSGGTKVALVETDFRRPVLARTHKLRLLPGLAEALTHGIALDDVIQHVNAVPVSNQGEVQFDVIVAGATPPNPSELIESHKMAEVLQELSLRYDLVIIDTPPSSLVSDAFPLIRKVSGVIVVSSVDQTTRDAAEHLRDQLESLSAHTLGVIANRIKTRRGGHYGYGYYYAESAATLASDGASGRAPSNGHAAQEALVGATQEQTSEKPRSGAGTSEPTSEQVPDSASDTPARSASPKRGWLFNRRPRT